MASNFEFLKNGWLDLYDDTVEVERNIHSAPRTAVVYARRALELAVFWIFDHDNTLRKPYKETLSAFIHEPSFSKLLSPGLFNHIRLIQKAGNLAVHSRSKVTESESLQVARALFTFLGWMAQTYSKQPPKVLNFDENLIPPADKAVLELSIKQIQELQKQLDAQNEQSRKEQAARQQDKDAIEKLQAEIAGYKQANATITAGRDYTEQETRTLFIDFMLKEAGWDPQAPDATEYEVIGMPNDNGIGYVDYVLWGKDKLPLAVVEAKKTTRDAREGQQQAKLYADCLEEMTGQRPIIFYTNGYESWIWDDVNYPPRAVQGFYNMDELQLAINRRQSRKDIIRAEINEDITNRYYQKEAIQRVMERFGKEKAHGSLLVMATGSGKTRVAVSIVDVLMRCNWVKRVLFLADRTALVGQAKTNFGKHLPDVSGVNLVKEKDQTGSRIYFSTYPTMMNMIDYAKSDGSKRFGPGFFDLVIIDEAHRSVYQKYKAIFEYFDSMLLGLTATPKAEVDHDTYHLFDLERNVPTYAYELDQAVSDGFLVPPQPYKVPMKFQRSGVRYADLTDEEKLQYEEKFYDDESGTLPDAVEPAALNKWLFNTDTVDMVLKHLMEHGMKIEGGDKLGKTIIFAKNHDHAVFIEERFNKNYPHLKGSFLRVIDNKVEYAQSLIDDFSVAKKDPFIAVSVDMLDTGIDVPEVLNLVFFKMLRSKTKFWQMIGRGTRLCEDLFAPGEHKEQFYIFDFCDNFEFFGQNPDGYTSPQQQSITQRIFNRRLSIVEFMKKAMPEDKPRLHSDLLDAMHAVVAGMNPDNFIVRPHLRYVDMFKKRERWDMLSLSDIVDIREHLTHLPSVDNDDEFARRFDLLCLNMQLAMLEANALQERYVELIKALASGLLEKGAVPAVADKMALIREIQTDEFWENVSVDRIEDVRVDLRELIKFVDKDGQRRKVYTSFEDEILVSGRGELAGGLIKADPALKNYRQKVERFVQEHKDHETIRKLWSNEIITAVDIKALEDILFGDGGVCSREDYVSTYGEDEPLGVLIRRIVGLDRKAAKEVFSKYLDSGNLSADQIRFIDMIIDHLSANGVIEPSVLFSPPFTDLHDMGIAGVMPDIASEIVDILEKVNNNAVAA